MTRIAVLSMVFAGCEFAPECTAKELRCDGGVIERCTRHPAFTDVSIDTLSAKHYRRSPNTWDVVATCPSAALCITPVSGDPFCALSQSAACPTDGGFALTCDGTSLIECRAGFVVETELCKRCDTPAPSCFLSACCHGNVDDGSCQTDDNCLAGAKCTGQPGRCQLPCGCADEASCAVCDPALHSQANNLDQGKPSTWVCRQGFCTVVRR